MKVKLERQFTLSRINGMKSFSTIVACVFAVFITNTNADSSGRSFEAVGSVASFYIEGSNTNMFLTKFRAIVSNCVVSIRSEYVPYDPNTGTEFVEYVTYGSNSTLRVRHSEVADDNTHKAGDSKSKTGVSERPGWNRDTILVRPDQLPPYGFEFVTIVWLALGSRCTLPGLGEALVEPVVNIEPGVREARLKTRAHFQAQNGGPGFLAFMAEFCDGESTALPGQYGAKHLKAPFEGGYTNAIFRSIQWTNVAGSEMPSEFELVKFRPDYSEMSSKLLKPTYWLKGHIESYVIGSTKALIPSNHISEPTRVVDYSVTDQTTRNPYSSYNLKNGQLLSPEQVKEVLARRNARLATVSAKRPRILILVVLSAVALTSLIVLLAFRRLRDH